MIAICKACGSIILAGAGATVVTVETPGRPGRRMTVCSDCAELILRRLRGRPADLAEAASG